MAVFKNVNFELAQALIKYGKSHRLNGGCYKWWGIVRYLRTNVDELRGLVENDKNLTQNKKIKNCQKFGSFELLRNFIGVYELYFAYEQIIERALS